VHDGKLTAENGGGEVQAILSTYVSGHLVYQLMLLLKLPLLHVRCRCFLQARLPTWRLSWRCSATMRRLTSGVSACWITRC
jgi:hypothetical protein